MLVYIHVPFCKTRCSYCAFYSEALGKGEGAAAPRLQAYVDTLFREIAQAADRLGSKTAQSVFFGGGTPSLLPPAIVGTILDRVNKAFPLAEKAEITLEANPESLRGKNPGNYLAAGVNRLSIGVQSLDDAMLRELGRIHKAPDAVNAISAARDAGFTNLGVDLMWGLPGQSVRQWLQTIKDVVKLNPDHISAYNLTLEPGTELERACEEKRLVLPPERDQSIMFMEGSALLAANGFLQYEVSNFARMGFQCRHNTGYWEGAEYLGLGPSATSTIGSERWTNPANIAAWTERVNKGRGVRDIEILTPKIRLMELVMLRLRTARGLRLKAYKDMTGRDFLRDHQKFVQTMHENGLARIRNGYLSLTRSGMLVSNAIISNLFERMSDDAPPPKAIAIAEPEPQAIPVVWPTADPRRQ